MNDEQKSIPPSPEIRLDSEIMQIAGDYKSEVQPQKKSKNKTVIFIVIVVVLLLVAGSIFLATRYEASSTVSSDEVSGPINMLSTVINMVELNNFNEAVEKYALPSSPLRGADSQHIDITALVGSDVSWGECEISNKESYPSSENTEDEGMLYDVVYVNTTCPATSGKKTIVFDIRRAQGASSWSLYFLALRSVGNV